MNPRHLRYASRAENEADKVRHGTSNRGERHGLSKLTASQVREIKQLSDARTNDELAELFGVKPPTIDAIRRGKRWKHI